MGYCPEQAVEAGHSVGMTLYYVTAVPLSTEVLNLLDDSVPWLANLQGTGAEWIVQYPFPALHVSRMLVPHTPASNSRDQPGLHVHNPDAPLPALPRTGHSLERHPSEMIPVGSTLPAPPAAMYNFLISPARSA
jgi:hypothetical protein